MKVSKLRLLLVTILIVMGISCNFISPIKNLSIPANNSIEEPTLVIATQNSQDFPPPYPQPTNSPCEAEKWRVYPSAVYQSLLRDGWRLVIVEFSFENLSDQWGIISIDNSDIFITTEGGYTYNPFSGWLEVPELPQSPYSGTTFHQPLLYFSDIIPPSFTVTGVLDKNRELHRYVFGFEIADNQKYPIINIQNATGFCKLDGVNSRDFPIPPNSTPIEDIRQATTSTATTSTTKPVNSFDNFGQPLELQNIGNIKFTDIQRTSDSLIIKFEFTNASGGYDTSGIFRGNIIGDDGLIREIDCEIVSCYHPGGFTAGPGQTVKAEDLGYFVPETLQNLKFIWIDEQSNIYQVLNIYP